MAESRQAMDLIFFTLGGAHFGAPAQGMASIAAANWQPERELDASLDLYSLLGVQRRTGSRVLLIRREGGVVGVKVDEISARMIGSHKVLPVPKGLSAWLKIQALLGIAEDPDYGIIPVLDLDVLAKSYAGAS